MKTSSHNGTENETKMKLLNWVGDRAMTIKEAYGRGSFVLYLLVAWFSFGIAGLLSEFIPYKLLSNIFFSILFLAVYSILTLKHLHGFALKKLKGGNGK